MAHHQRLQERGIIGWIEKAQFQMSEPSHRDYYRWTLASHAVCDPHPIAGFAVSDLLLDLRRKKSRNVDSRHRCDLHVQGPASNRHYHDDDGGAEKPMSDPVRLVDVRR